MCQRRQNSAIDCDGYGCSKFFTSRTPSSSATPRAMSLCGEVAVDLQREGTP